jgi:hypothetical protein
MITWTFTDDCDDATKSCLQDGNWRQDKQIVKENKRRTVYYCAPREQVPGLYVKLDHPPGLRDTVKNLWRCKAAEEFRAGLQLHQAHVPVVKMLAWGRDGRNSMLVSQAAAEAQLFREAWNVVRNDTTQRREFIDALIAFTVTLVSAGVDHPDLHEGNVLYTADNARFQLVDLYGIRVDVDSPASRGRALAWLYSFLRQLETDDQKHFASGLFGDAISPPLSLPEVCDFHAHLAQKYWTSRRGRYTTNHNVCFKFQWAEGNGVAMRSMAETTLIRCLAIHDENIARGCNVLKSGLRRRLSEVTVEGQTYVVKEFVSPGPWGPWRPDIRAWRTAQRLQMYPVPTAAALTWLQTKDGRGIIILNKTGDENLAVRLRDNPTSPDCVAWCEAAGRFLGWLHLSNIVPRDMKLSNVMFHTSPEYPSMPLTLVDTDDISFERQFPLQHGSKNLQQMFDGIPDSVQAEGIPALIAAYKTEIGITVP